MSTLPVITTFEDAEHFLYDVLPKLNPKQLFDEQSIARSAALYELLGNPQESFKSVHIAGTSGKGSTSLYLTALLRSQGFKVGTTLSPHVYDVRERALLNGELPDKTMFVSTLNAVLPHIYAMSERSQYGSPSYFDVCIGQAFTIFASQNVDYAVIETGLGGLYDSTNTVKRPDKLAVVTKIGLDHTDVLGTTLPEIARQKAGIFPPEGRGLYLKPAEKEIEKVFTAVASKRRTRLKAIDTSKLATNVRLKNQAVVFDYHSDVLQLQGVTLPTLALYQVENVCSALAAFEALAARDGFLIDAEAVKTVLASTRIPGRMELREINGRKLLLDGAHNEQKMAELLTSIDALHLPQKPVWLVAFKKGKDARGMFKLIRPYADKVVITNIFEAHSPWLRGKSTHPEEITAIAKSEGLEVAGTTTNPKEALRIALQQSAKDQLIIASGSMYLLGEL